MPTIKAQLDTKPTKTPNTASPSRSADGGLPPDGGIRLAFARLITS